MNKIFTIQCPDCNGNDVQLKSVSSKNLSLHFKCRNDNCKQMKITTNYNGVVLYKRYNFQKDHKKYLMNIKYFSNKITIFKNNTYSGFDTIYDGKLVVDIKSLDDAKRYFKLIIIN